MSSISRLALFSAVQLLSVLFSLSIRDYLSECTHICAISRFMKIITSNRREYEYITVLIYIYVQQTLTESVEIPRRIFKMK